MYESSRARTKKNIRRHYLLGEKGQICNKKNAYMQYATSTDYHVQKQKNNATENFDVIMLCAKNNFSSKRSLNFFIELLGFLRGIKYESK